MEDRVIAAELLDETEVTFPLDVRRAVTMQNELKVEFRLEGVDKSGKTDSRHETAQVSFIAKPADRRWWDYQIVMWQQHTPEMFGALKQQFGITAGQYSGRATTPPQFLLSNNLRWYAENIATDFYAEYHRYRRDRKQNWSFLEAKELYKKDLPAKKRSSAIPVSRIRCGCRRFNSVCEAQPRSTLPIGRCSTIWAMSQALPIWPRIGTSTSPIIP